MSRSMSRSVPGARSGTLPARAVPGPQPSSLLQMPSACQPRCSRCRSSRVTRLAMTLTDGTPVAFTSCRDCEHRVWAAVDEVADGPTTSHGSPIPVTEVLQRASKERAAS